MSDDYGESDWAASRPVSLKEFDLLRAELQSASSRISRLMQDVETLDGRVQLLQSTLLSKPSHLELFLIVLVASAISAAVF